MCLETGHVRLKLRLSGPPSSVLVGASWNGPYDLGNWREGAKAVPVRLTRVHLDVWRQPLANKNLLLIALETYPPLGTLWLICSSDSLTEAVITSP